MRHSISLRLLFILLLTIIITSGISITISHYKNQHEIQELFDAQLVQNARMIKASFLSSNTRRNIEHQQHKLEENIRDDKFSDDDDDEHDRHGHVYERLIAFKVWDKNNNLVLYSSAAPVALPVNNIAGFHDVFIATEKWRVFSLWTDDGQYLIETADNYDIRDELAEEISGHFISNSLISIPVLAILILLAVNQGLKPLNKIAAQVQSRQPGYLGAIDIKNIPSEILPLVESLNTLFSRVTHTLETERHFTDNAAHELRTPLAALKTQAQVALRSDQPQEKQQALQQIVHGVDRLSHLVQQLLTLARIGQGEMNISTEKLHLYQCTAEVIAELTNKALRKNIDLSLEGDEAIDIKTNKPALEMLLRNVIDNAINYSYENGSVKVSVNTTRGTPGILVTDTGPGIPTEIHSQVFERFYRINHHQQPGCGLGLAIAKQCADLIHATIKLETPENGHGLAVRIIF
ncbi:MAG: ATP-binding protein [Gammaproteobacteria bacterium]|nr:ATP-binding protein [Gammaproteobacteria bacterium]